MIAEGETGQNIIKVTCKDFPLSKANSAIESYLIKQGIKLKTKPEYAKARNKLNELTEWLDGDRLLLVEKTDEPFPRKTWISRSSVWIFHQEGHFINSSVLMIPVALYTRQKSFTRRQGMLRHNKEGPQYCHYFCW